jgi:hypothetical protein
MRGRWAWDRQRKQKKYPPALSKYGGCRMLMGLIAGLRKAVSASVLAIALAPSAWAQGGQPSELVVNRLLSYTWAITPQKFTENGKTILIDKSGTWQNVISREAAAEVIRGGYRTYEAELCGLEEAASNFKTVILRAKAKHNWNDQQLVFGRQLHLAAIQYSKGGLELAAEDADKNKEILKKIPQRDPKECTDARRKRVQDAIYKFLKEDAGSQPGKRAEPILGTQKK